MKIIRLLFFIEGFYYWLKFYISFTNLLILFGGSYEKGATFKIEIKPEETSKFRISYRQKLLGNRAEYILTTTQSWGRPLEQANYTLIIPNKLSIDSLSYTPDSFETKRDRIIFFWEKENFMPDRNFIIILSD